MNDLERRALLGDRQAQEECTRRGIVLPCPQCYGHVSIMGVAQAESMTRMTFVCDNGCTGVMGVTLTQDFVYSAVDRRSLNASPLAQWNERPAPPIGRCRECASACNPGENIVTCEIFERDMMPDDFCSQFEPKGGEENGTAPD